ncbi:MAG: ankyrin repeat domain-containing protein [Nitrospirae bacterium]|nr:ankyrin repeat domain-containing protein [Nitrospirota bacterium]
MAGESRQSRGAAQRRAARIIGIIFILIMLAAGLLLGTESTLSLRRDDNGNVTAVNAWRIGGHITLLKRTVRNLREVKMQAISLTQKEVRSSAYRNAFGMLSVPEQLVLLGDSILPYPYREDLSLISGFLANKAKKNAMLLHPLDIRRKVSSWVLLVLAVLSIAGMIVTKVMGRDPLAGAPRKVKPLPPAIGQAVFLCTIAALIWFFSAGHLILGPVAVKKVRHLFEAARANDAVSINKTARSGVFLDVRDDQGTTALMVAARMGADRAVDALLKAGANPDVSNLSDNTALLLAVQGNHAETAMLLLNAGADAGLADMNGRNALHKAAEGGDAAMIRRILEAGVKVDAADAHGWTPLFFAAASGNADAVLTLLNAGADARKKLPDGRTPLDLVHADPAVSAVLIKAAGR